MLRDVIGLIFYILPEARYSYNAANGDVAHNVPSAGVYYDGYGFSDNDIKNYQWRGCRNAVDNDNYPTMGSFCVAMIAKIVGKFLRIIL